MIIDHGCAPATPGIGNIAYVKDLQIEEIVTTNFRCSVFGGYHDSTTGFGWVISYNFYTDWECMDFGQNPIK